MKLKLWVSCSVLALFSVPVSAELPFEFTANAGASAAEVNANFQYLDSALDMILPHGHASGCANLPDHGALKIALKDAVGAETSGLNNEMWATLVDRDGVVCAVAFSGADRGAQWPGSRVISAQKANTANAFSLDDLALSTANLFTAVQPGQSLFGLQESNPVDVRVAYKGPSSAYGSADDPMTGQKIGGVNVFGGGLGLYAAGSVVGGVGVSGDTSCADHMIGWRVRHNLGLDALGGPKGVNAADEHPDNIIYDINKKGVSASGFGHATCLNTDENPNTSLPPVSLSY